MITLAASKQSITCLTWPGGGLSNASLKRSLIVCSVTVVVPPGCAAASIAAHNSSLLLTSGSAPMGTTFAGFAKYASNYITRGGGNCPPTLSDSKHLAQPTGGFETSMISAFIR